MRDEKTTLVLGSFLASLGHEIERVEWNKTQERFDAPIHNAGTCYRTDEFVMRSYCWDEDGPLHELPNFRCDDFQAEWYKYYRRSLQCYEISIDQLSDIFSRCWHSIEKSGRECNRDGTDFDSYNSKYSHEVG